MPASSSGIAFTSNTTSGRIEPSRSRLRISVARELTSSNDHRSKANVIARGHLLDNRADYTKADWIVWTATLAETPGDFSALVEPIRTFLHETPDRVPFTDWYSTTSGLKRGWMSLPGSSVSCVTLVPSTRWR